MQDQYAFDIGDFGKIGLLRAIGAGSQGVSLRCGVVWCMASGLGNAGDGRHTAYLFKDAGYRECDPGLYDLFAENCRSGVRSVSRLESCGALPPRAVCFRDQVPARPATLRAKWIADSLHATAEADVVLFDPDNGVVPQKQEQSQMRSGVKYIWPHEIVPFFARGQSVIVYQHATREGTFQMQIAGLASRLARLEGMAQAEWLALIWRPYSARAFLFACQPKHVHLLRRTARGMAETSWRGRFEFVDIGRPDRN